MVSEATMARLPMQYTFCTPGTGETECYYLFQSTQKTPER